MGKGYPIVTKLFKTRLSYRLTRDTVLLAMLLGLVLNLIQVSFDYRSALTGMDQDIQALMDISHSPASQIAYNIDTRLAGELLEGMLHHPAVIDARLVDPDQRTVAAASGGLADFRYPAISDLLFGDTRYYRAPLQVNELPDIPLGDLALTITPRYFGEQFLDRALFTIVSGFFKSLALSALLLFAFYFVLTKPILRVIETLEQAKDDPEKTRLPTPPTHEQDEIGTMVGIINRHLETVENSLSQMREVESRMKDYSIALEREVEDRTREISEKNEALQRGNRALVKAKEDAVNKARSRASFLASMSHEIRTPLNGVLGMLELALEGDLEPKQRHHLAIARTAGQSLLSLLNDILDISKVEAGKLSLEVIGFDLRELVRECATLHREQARRKGLDFTIDLHPGLAGAYLGDPTRLQQILNNLLSNAIKFTDKGTIVVSIAPAKNGVRIEVSDTGIGMTTKQLDRIFSPFSQANTDTTRRYGGTGLGLSLCYQLVEHMHGQITVTSGENEGSRFVVTLPLAVDQGSGEKVETAPARRATDIPVQIRSCRILLVEDNRVNQIVASALLQKLGHEVDHAENGERALAALATRTYDMILMDCQMPVMDGYEATRRIRQHPEWQQLPIIAVTANVMAGDQEACIAAGMDDYITKPYNRQTLNEVIQRWAARSSSTPDG